MDSNSRTSKLEFRNNLSEIYKLGLVFKKEFLYNKQVWLTCDEVKGC